MLSPRYSAGPSPRLRCGPPGQWDDRCRSPTGSCDVALLTCRHISNAEARRHDPFDLSRDIALRSRACGDRTRVTNAVRKMLGTKPEIGILRLSCAPQHRTTRGRT